MTEFGLSRGKIPSHPLLKYLYFFRRNSHVIFFFFNLKDNNKIRNKIAFGTDVKINKSFTFV